MGMEWNLDKFSGLNGNWNIVYDFPRLGIGTKSWEWEGMGTRKSFPHMSNIEEFWLVLIVLDWIGNGH